jgi:hypothetical protein
LVLYLLIIYLLCNTYSRRTTDRAFDFLIGRKHSRKDRQVKVSFRELKAQIYWPATDQKVRGSNPCERTIGLKVKPNHDSNSLILYPLASGDISSSGVLLGVKRNYLIITNPPELVVQRA